MDAGNAEPKEREPAGQEFFQANLAAFKEHAPHLHGRLAAIDRPHSSLVAEPDGSLDMAFLGKRFYEMDAVAFADTQLEQYFAQPSRFTLSEPDPARLGGVTTEFCDLITGGLAERGIAYDPEHCPDDAYYLVVFGVGLGLQVESLVRRCHARVVALVEPNIEFLYHSLFVTDWQQFFKLAEEQDLKISFVVERQPKTIMIKLRSILRSQIPTFIDGIYLFSHYQSALLDQARKLFRDDLYVVLAGLGFFEDEVLMTRNAAGNLAGGDVDMLCAYHSPKEEPVFIVGSGPSLEQDLDFVVAHADRAMIFSVGTALRILLERGLRPDFHCELENNTFNVELMQATAAEFDLSGINLIASVSVQPGMVELFDRACLFFRENVSSSKIFAGDLQILQPAGPTVANTALISGIRMGFREFYLFGVDMGSRDATNFHAKGSVYSLGKFPDMTKAKDRFAASLGGEVSGELVFNWSRLTLESVIRVHQDLTVYNCSDGARIQGAIPKVSRAVDLSAGAFDHARVKSEIAAQTTRVTLERNRGLWRHRKFGQEAQAFFAEVRALLEPVARQSEPGGDWIEQLGGLVVATARSSPVIISYLAGTFLIMSGISRYYDRRIVGVDDRAVFRRMAAEGILEITRQVEQDLRQLFEEVEEGLAPAA